MKTALRWTLLFALVASLACAGTASAVSLSLTPSSTTGNVGGTISFTVNLDTQGTSLVFAQFDINYNETVLEYTSHSALSGSFASGGVTDPYGGFQPPPPIQFLFYGEILAGSYVITTLDFNIIAPPIPPSTETSLTFCDGSLCGSAPTIDFSYIPEGAVTDLSSGDATIGINSVPEPSTILLLGAGIAGLFVARRRRMIG